jgi:hypothetical protein
MTRYEIPLEEEKNEELARWYDDLARRLEMDCCSGYCPDDVEKYVEPNYGQECN